jgi:hypothetical protein
MEIELFFSVRIIVIRQYESTGWHTSNVRQRLLSSLAANSHPYCRESLLQLLHYLAAIFTAKPTLT